MSDMVGTFVLVVLPVLLICYIVPTIIIVKNASQAKDAVVWSLTNFIIPIIGYLLFQRYGDKRSIKLR
ncbi:hypothetical protein SAMN05660429_02086 [Thalassotalea agarivorans]|uniref:Phospholipase_D-nuclease N-terminal n=1 Tax=Thalassotalea agarivorans TaxID=349064 RepID=A0A1I0FF76_THASX|nr:hypothetical protein SAMN05660429_02086 [Thalassotalea agarivorans]